MPLKMRIGRLSIATTLKADSHGKLDLSYPRQCVRRPHRQSRHGLHGRRRRVGALGLMASNGSPELLIVMGAGATPDQTEHVLARLQEAGVHARVTHGREATVIGAIGERELLATLPLEGYPGVEQVLPILKPYKLVAREVSPDPTVIDVDGHRLGQEYFGLIAGPCSIEYREQTMETARAVAEAGATVLRGGAFKPRTSPYTFQALGAGGV